MGKSEARKLREQAMPISVISMNQIQGTVNNVQDILAKTAGITVRARVERAVPLAYRCADWKANASGFSLTGIR